MSRQMGVIVIALCTMTSMPARAHDWFTGLKDPITNHACCTGYSGPTTHVDCKEIPKELLDSGAIVEVKEGYHVRLTLEQARYFNDQTTAPIDEIVEWNRVQPGLASGLYMCIWKDAVNCFFGPSNT